MSIFGDHPRFDPRPSLHGENTFSFLRRVSGNYWDQCRKLIDSWVSNFPDSDRSSLIGQLTSGDDHQFTSAFWELYLHETYRRDGWTITIHPSVPNAPTHPDFFVEKGDRAHYIEARCVYGDEDRAAQGRLNSIYAAVDKIDSGPFHLAVTAHRIGAMSPSSRKLTGDLEHWLQGLDPDKVNLSLGSENEDAFDWVLDDWRIRFVPIPRDPEVRGAPARRPIGLHMPPGAEFIDDIHPFRKALEKKGRHYGLLPYPLLIAIHTVRGFHGDSDTTQALFGTVGCQLDFQDPSREATPVITEQGFWRGKNAPRNSHVSGIILADTLHYGAVASIVPTYWPNPWATEEVTPLSLWSRINYANSTLNTAARIDPASLPYVHFDLPRDWPQGTAFERN